MFVVWQGTREWWTWRGGDPMCVCVCVCMRVCVWRWWWRVRACLLFRVFVRRGAVRWKQQFFFVKVAHAWLYE